jgi:hypothetical protein
VTYLSRLASLGLAKEATQGTYVVPTDSIPFTKASYNDAIDQLRDESIRANDAVLQGLYQGPWTTAWDIDTNAYPDITGHFLRGIIGPDTVVAGVSTTLAASASAGASTVSATASIAANTVVQLDTAGLIEYAKVTAVSGSGPYSLTLASPLTLAHSSGVAVVAQTTHTFVQNRTSATVWPSYSLTVNDLTEVRGWPGCVQSELQLKIDPKGIVTISPKYIGWPSAVQSSFSPAYSSAQPQRGWGWTMTNAGGSSTRGLSFDVTFKRATEPIHSSDGTQGPREVFAGAMEIDGGYKAIFENVTDLNLYMLATQTATTATLTEPAGGQLNAGTSLAITMSKSGWTKGQVDLGQTYVQCDFDLSGIYNTTDTGVASVVLKNFRNASY